jgi:hypothetical protein
VCESLDEAGNQWKGWLLMDTGQETGAGKVDQIPDLGLWLCRCLFRPRF